MNANEFKAWFEGFTDSLDGPPGVKAWDKIVAKVKTLYGPAYTVQHWPNWYTSPQWQHAFAVGPTVNNVAGTATWVLPQGLQAQQSFTNQVAPSGDHFNPVTWRQLGADEARDLD